MATNFTFADFLVFSGATNINEDMYVTIAKGVIDYIHNQYGIYPEEETLPVKAFLTSGQLSYTPTVYPVDSVYRIWYDTDIVEDDTYSYYGEDILFLAAFTDIRKPITLELNVGFASIPEDLILAIYRHIIAVYHAIDKHSDNVSKVINSSGSTSYFTNDVVPPASKQTYDFYAGRTLVRN